MRKIAVLILVLALAACESPPPTTILEPVDPTASPTDPPPPIEEGETDCRYEAQITDEGSFENGSEVLLGASVEKTWVMVNTGTCAWTEGVQFVQIGGGFLQAVEPETPMPAVVDVGDQIRLTIPLTLSEEAPTGTEQEAVFQLRGPEGSFGPTPFVLVMPVEDDPGLDIPTPTPRDG